MLRIRTHPAWHARIIRDAWTKFPSRPVEILTSSPNRFYDHHPTLSHFIHPSTSYPMVSSAPAAKTSHYTLSVALAPTARTAYSGWAYMRSSSAADTRAQSGLADRLLYTGCPDRLHCKRHTADTEGLHPQTLPSEQAPGLPRAGRCVLHSDLTDPIQRPHSLGLVFCVKRQYPRTAWRGGSPRLLVHLSFCRRRIARIGVVGKSTVGGQGKVGSPDRKRGIGQDQRIWRREGDGDRGRRDSMRYSRRRYRSNIRGHSKGSGLGTR